MGSGSADGQAAGYVAHLHIDLGGDGNADRDQDDEGYVKEYRDGYNVTGQVYCKARSLLSGCFEHQRSDLAGTSGQMQKISKGNAQDDQDTDTLHGASESGRQSCGHVGQRHSCQDTHDQSAKQQRQERMQIKFDNGHQNENQRHCKYSK